uniref:NAD(P)(+)--arginine ADP-ribosyltransferase n=1 Tax=Xenopus tropicalis TaxID=8364 RepID=A0A803JHU8_XENTR
MSRLFLLCIALCPDLLGDIPDYYEVIGAERISNGSCPGQDPVRSYNPAPKRKCNLLNLDLMPNAFDDEYEGCAEELERDSMPKVLKMETYQNPVFGLAWKRAEKDWNKVKSTLRLPLGFTDAFGTAIRVYTTDWPEGNPLYKAFNGNVSSAGRSREHYMEHFHFKALHFYLTRAMQVLRRNSRRRYRTYRGTDGSYEVSEELLRFGRFTSSSLNVEVAKGYNAGLLFEITTCFGVDIHRVSFFPKEREVLIPVAEKFHYVGKRDNIYVMNSTCQLCTYFNCAYLGEEKREVPVCSSGRFLL